MIQLRSALLHSTRHPLTYTIQKPYSSFMSVINNRDGHNVMDHLVPSKESLDKLHLFELSSFSDSQNLEEYDTSYNSIGHKSDDPFDPADLIGLVGVQPLQNIVKDEPVKKEEQLPKASISHNSSQHSSTTLETNIKHETQNSPTSPVLNYSRKNIESINSSPSHAIFKKPRSLTSSPVRQFSTSSIAEALRQIQEDRQVENDDGTKKGNNYVKLVNLPNPTIQLATQRPLAGMINEQGEAGQSEGEKVVKPIILSAEQEYVLQLAKEGKSIFFTGSAGTGKSVLLRAIIKALKTKHGKSAVAVTASTGLAACNIGGITVHSFAGFGLGKGKAPDLLKMVRRNRKASMRWNYTNVLVIDEISMIDAKLFEKLDYVARHIRRKKNVPFGGLQLIVCGDFYQLPPVSKIEYQVDGSELKEDAAFAFESESWNQVVQAKIILKEVFRQKGDQKFIDILNDMRHGVVTPAAEAEFARLSRPLSCPAGIVPTELYATRYEVDSANNMKLAQLRGSTRLFESKDGGTLPLNIRSAMLMNFLAPQKLFLKLNAQVMCIKNFDDTLVNGSLGKVVGFLDRDTYMCSEINKQLPNLSFDEFQKVLKKKKVEFVISQKEAEAGKTLDTETKLKLSQDIENSSQPLLDSVFNFFYENTEHSSETTEEQMTTEQLVSQNRKRKFDFIQQIQQSSKGEKFPLVRFLNPDGVTTRDVLVEPEKWEITDDKSGEVLASRVQLPLMLAWALSIHKSQGQTLQKVKVDLTRIFENGQAYVALSRAVSRDGLQVVNFSKQKVRTHSIVEEFYESLSTSEDLAYIKERK